MNIPVLNLRIILNIFGLILCEQNIPELSFKNIQKLSLRGQNIPELFFEKVKNLSFELVWTKYLNFASKYFSVDVHIFNLALNGLNIPEERMVAIIFQG